MVVQNDPLIGTEVAGRYKVIKRLGEGGMGQVYLAMHEVIEKKVALKILRPEYSEKPDIVTRFQQEAISASRIKHPNVLEVFDFGQLENNGCFFLAMEFLEGRDLSDEISAMGVMEPNRAVPIALQICRALGAAHSRGVVHRDMKPENVFLQRTTDGEEIVKIVDFGIAQLRSPDKPQGESPEEPKRRRLTKTGMIFGTPEYMAPEQAAGKQADLRVDVYATGIILYEMFTGAVPFTGETFMAVLASQLNDDAPGMREIVPDLALSRELEAVIMHTLAKKPDDRFQSMAELAAAITATPEGEFASRLTLTTGGASMSHVGPSISSAGSATAAQFAGGGQANQTKGQFGDASDGELGGGSPEIDFGDEERPVTQLEAAGTLPPESPRSRKAPLIATVLVALGVACAGTFFAMSSGDGDGDEVAAPAVNEGTAGAGTAAETAPKPPPTAEPEPPPRPAFQGIRLAVTTDPPGAVIMKDGFQVCEASPCEVIAAPNETLELTAELGKRKGSKKVLAQNDQSIAIKLSKPKPKVRTPRIKDPPPVRPKNRLCEKEFDGIKILVHCDE